ncbi:MAG: glutamate synthase [Candidatus Latescibacteria bacterium]|nr:glutamate synthase [Candidatus Latescibacterota bacterium]
MNNDVIQKIKQVRKKLNEEYDMSGPLNKVEEEGGCGVIGFCCTEPVPGRHIYEPSVQMHNRGNGKGGGVAAVGFVPEQLGVSREILGECYMLHIALLDTSVRQEVEDTFITPYFDVYSSGKLDTVGDWKSIEGLEVKPPDVMRYFVRIKSNVLDTFIRDNSLESMDRRDAEDEFVNQNSFRLNRQYYASLGVQKAFVASHGRNIMILKVVGYAEAIVKYYRIEGLCAHVWIAHQRYPTKGRVWHPGGAHPFAGINMALVHNGDFANYFSVTEYLKQKNIYPQFLTDTEVAVLLFDLFDRTYHYPLEYIIEALAPTTELDFDRLPQEKQKAYRSIQAAHIHGSPDGPWFFIIARNIPHEDRLQLLGITDTAMLRPQVFAFSDGEVQVGVISSEKQAIDATFLSLSKEDTRINPVADRYWNARGGSHTDGGAFIFNLDKNSDGKFHMSCTDKFGDPVKMPGGTESLSPETRADTQIGLPEEVKKAVKVKVESGNTAAVYEYIRDSIPNWSYGEFKAVCRYMIGYAQEPQNTEVVIDTLTILNDRYYSTGTKKRSHLLYVIRSGLDTLFRSLPHLSAEVFDNSRYRFIDFESRNSLRAPKQHETTLIIDASKFPPEGEQCDAALLFDAYLNGWRRFICFGYLGQRFVGCGLGPGTDQVFIDVYGSSGDYLGSGIDGLTIKVHNNAQDQLGQIIKSGKLVIYGDVGQTFMYGAKGGSVFVLGNAAGRPLINAVGKPRVVINGTCLDFLAESFMAGDPHNGGGFVILNGVEFDDDGNVAPNPEPYPGSNLFSLASGGAIFIRDPQKSLVEQQLNGGAFSPFNGKDWKLILPYLEENERLFGITVEDLLTVNGELQTPQKVYRKVVPTKVAALASGVADVYIDDKTVEEIIME